MQEITFDEQHKVAGGSVREASCISAYTVLGAFTGVLIGGMFTSGLGAVQGGIWGAGFGSQLGSAACLR